MRGHFDGSRQVLSARKLIREYPDSKWVPEAAGLLSEVLKRQGREPEAAEIRKKQELPKADERSRGTQASEAPG